MYRVIRVAGPSALIVERDNVQSEVRLTGIEIIDAPRAVDYLTWTVGSSWVMVDKGFVYRSPDALFINEELIRKGYARPGESSSLGSPRVPATYLGELDLGVRPPARAIPLPRAAKVAKPSAVRRRVVRSRTVRAPLR
jgi:hypothetical protein